MPMKNPELLSVSFLKNNGEQIGELKKMPQILDQGMSIARRLRGSIPKETDTIDVRSIDGKLTTIIYGTRERIDQYFAKTKDPSPLGECNAFDNIPGLNFMVDLRKTLRYEIDVPTPYELGENVAVERYRDDLVSLPRQLELKSLGYRRVADLFDSGTDREGDYIDFVRAIQEAQHLGEAVIVIQKGDHHLLFIQTERNAFNVPVFAN